MNIAVRLCGDRLPPLEIVFFRGFLDTLFLIPLMLWKRIPVFGHNQKELIYRGIYGSIGIVCIVSALRMIPVADATVLFRSTPLFVPFVAWVVLKDPLRANRVCFAAIGLVGSLFILKPGMGAVSYGGLISLLGAFAGSLACVTIRSLSAREHPLSIMLAFLMLSAFFSGVFGFQSFLAPTGVEWSWLLLIAVSGVLGQYLVTLGFASASVGVVTPWTYAELVFVGLLGVIFLDQIPDGYSLFGMLIVLSSAILVAKCK